MQINTKKKNPKTMKRKQENKVMKFKDCLKFEINTSTRATNEKPNTVNKNKCIPRCAVNGKPLQITCFLLFKFYNARI